MAAILFGVSARDPMSYAIVVGVIATVSLVATYREAYGLLACSGILFNHESPLRPDRFVTRKITAAAARIANGSRERLRLGDLSIRRDWGWAPDYVDAIAAMMRQPRPDDFVVATGISPRGLRRRCLREVGLEWHDHVDRDPALIRPSEIALSVGDAGKAKAVLGWHPKVPFDEIVARMVAAETDAEGPLR
jgi:GDPmannose 4,6-dehydratase